MTKKDWDLVKNNIENEVYKIIRLCELRNGKYEVIIPFNKSTLEKLKERYNYIYTTVHKKLNKGTYQLQCRLSPTNQAIQDNYEIIISGSELTEIIQDKTGTQQNENDMNISFEEHIQLIKENANLKAMNSLLETERDFYKVHYENNLLAKPLGDPSTLVVGKTTGEIIAGVLSDVAPALFGLSEKYMQLMEKKIDSENNNNTFSRPTIKKKMPQNKQVDNEAIERASEIEAIENANGSVAMDEALDSLENENVDLYLRVCKILNIELED
jgi:hypothetical protein